MKEYITDFFSASSSLADEVIALRTFLDTYAQKGYSLKGMSAIGEYCAIIMEREAPEVHPSAHLTKEDYETLRKATDWLNFLLVGTELSDKNDSRREGLLETKVALWQLAERAGRL